MRPPLALPASTMNSMQSCRFRCWSIDRGRSINSSSGSRIRATSPLVFNNNSTQLVRVVRHYHPLHAHRHHYQQNSNQRLLKRRSLIRPRAAIEWQYQYQYSTNGNILYYDCQLQARCFSTQLSNNDTDSGTGVDDQESSNGEEQQLQLVSIHDHLDELHKIPLADVRNFCIIAHVVRFCLLNCLFSCLLN